MTEYNDRRALPPAGPSASPGEVDSLRDEVADLGARLHRLEEERDFYKALLDAPPEKRSLPPSSTPDGSSGTH